ncbi:DUF2059 domain-containing protein [Luteimonas aestuarii]|nr:DUF2059 domain-containing protein [Luteimonas aestuarii]
MGSVFGHAMVVAVLAAGGLVPAMATERTAGERLTDISGFRESYQSGEDVCLERMAGIDPGQELAGNPDLLGGIVPSDPEWDAAWPLYLDLSRSVCQQDIDAAAAVFAQTLDAELSEGDLHALVAFYQTGLGQNYRAASLVANTATYRMLMESASSNANYAAFGEAIAGLVAARTAPPTKEPSQKTAIALPDADAAVALSDRAMRAVVEGRVADALEMVKPHTTTPDAQFDALLEQLEQQGPNIAARFGASDGYELLRNDTIGDSLVRPVFLHRFDNSAMIWLFTWYRGTQGWVMTGVRYADDVSLLFR